jgi:hypothetical protein
MAGASTQRVTFDADTKAAQAAITAIDRRLDAVNAKAKTTKRAALGGIRGSVAGVVAGDGVVKLGNGKFTVGGGFLRGAGGALVLVSGVAHGTKAIAEGYEKWRENERKYGATEASARFAAAANRVFMSPFKKVFELGTDAIGAVLKAATQSEEEALDYRIKANQLWDQTLGRFSMTTLEREEKWERYRAALRAATEEGAAYRLKEMTELDAQRPQNVRLRTTEDVAAYKETMRQKNGGIIARDAAELEKAARMEVKRAWAED